MPATLWTDNQAYDSTLSPWDSSALWDTVSDTWDGGNPSLLTPLPAQWTAVEP